MSEHTINELSALSGLSVRTIRYYLAQGLVPPAGREGSGTRYPDATLARLRLITRMRDAHLPLAEIRKRLAAMSDAEVVELSAEAGEPEPVGSALDYVRSALAGGGTSQTALFEALPSEPDADDLGSRTPLRQTVSIGIPAPPSMPPPADATTFGQRSQWERVAITPDIELHIRRPLSRRDNKMVERLIAFARQLQGEDRS